MGVRDFTTDPLRVDVLAADSCRGAILYGIYDLLTSVGSAWSYLTEGTPSPPLTRVRIVARTRRVSDLLCMSDPVHASSKGSMHDDLQRTAGRTAEGRGAS